MDFKQATGQTEALRALLELALHQGQINQTVIKVLLERACQLEGTVLDLENCHRSISLENYNERERANALNQQLKSRISDLEAIDRQALLERERAQWESRCRGAEIRNSVLDAQLTLFRDKIWKITGEGFPTNVDEFAFHDPSECPKCGKENLLHDFHNKFRCSFCGQTFTIEMPDSCFKSEMAAT